ncbi:MAG: hypothetical protein IJ781_06270 [Atopobiaceae bacterium]|nr:hypothetical protein [Atopobiaceae bacterium]
MKHASMTPAAAVADAANTVAAWCAMRDVSHLDRPSLCEEADISQGIADLFVLFGSGVTGLVDTLALAMSQGVAHRYAIVGGRGRATYWLDQAMEQEVANWPKDIAPAAPQPGIDSEAEMLNELLQRRHARSADFLERASTNCGNNISNLLDLLEESGIVPTSIILSQDAIMQRRMDATWRRQVADRPTFQKTKVINWAAYGAVLTEHDGDLAWERAPEGIWPINVYLDMLAGEVSRLTDDEQGYGPLGKDFVCHVNIPQAVLSSAALLLLQSER